MKLRTTFWGGDVLFEGDLPLVLRAIPAGARVTQARVTLTPAQGADQAEKFHEVFTIADGQGDFGLVVQTSNGWAIVDLGARRTVEKIEATGLAVASGANVQLDLGGMWLQLDKDGNLVQPGADLAFPVTDHSLILPNLTGQRLRLVNLATSGAPPQPVIIGVEKVSLLTYPSNLSLRLGNLGPFWFRTGDLRDPVTTPDFAEVFQGFLDRSQPANGIFEVPFILHSDALARLRMTLEVEYRLEQPLFPQLSQVVLPFGYGAVPSAQPVAIKALLPVQARVLPRATSAQVIGRFDDSRVIHGPVGVTTVTNTVQVSPEQSVAHPIQLSQTQSASAIDLHLEAVTSSATLLVTLQEDVGGKPWGPSLLAEPIQVKLDRPAAGGTMWVSAPLLAEFTFQAGRTYWLIVNSAEGQVNWAVEPANGLPPLQATRDAGLSWRAVQTKNIVGAVAGLYRLRARLPQFHQPIKLDVGGHPVSLSSFDALGKVDLKLDLPVLADAFNAALADAIQQQTNLAERVANGDFARWTRIVRRTPRLASQPLLFGNNVPAALAVAPDASQVYVAAAPPEKPGLVQIVANESQPRFAGRLDLATNVPVAGPLSLAISPNGQNLYVAALGSVPPPPGTEGAPGPQLIAWKVSVQDEGQLIQKELPFDEPIVYLAASPDCRWVYLTTSGVTTEHGRNPILIRLNANDLSSNSEADLLTLPPLGGLPLSLVITPDGRRAYVSYISVAAGQDTGVSGGLGRLAVSEGRLTFNAQGPGVVSGILVVDLERWQLLGRVGFNAEVKAGKTVIPLATSMALSCNGTRLYAVVFELSSGQANTTTPTPSLTTEQVMFALDAGVLDQARERALRVEEGVLARVSLGEVPTSQLNLQSLPSVAATPDDTRLLVTAPLAGARFTTGDTVRATTGQVDQLYVVDTTTYTQLDPIKLPASPASLAVTPDSRRAFVLAFKDLPVSEVPVTSEVTGTLQTVELDVWTADQWALTGGRVAPVCVPDAEKPTARLGSPADPTGLSQVFPVVGGQVYELYFRAWANAPGAKAELFWLNQDCRLLGELSIDIQQPPCGAGLQRHAIRGTAPQDADRAELRFRQPFGGYTLLDDVSFMAPVEATNNGDFTVRVPVTDPASQKPVIDPVTNQPVNTPQGWQVAPEDVPVNQMLIFRDEGGVRLAASDARPAVLSQALAVTPGKPFILEFEAFPFGKPSSRGNPTVELRWTGSQTEPARYELTPQRFDVTVIDGTVPADATGAELAFVQPPGGAVDVIQARVSQPDQVEVPVTFLSEAPGELTVAAPVVAYDLAAEPRPRPVKPQPPEPLGCKPTPPEDVPPPPEAPPKPGEKPMPPEPELEPGFCPCCETFHFLEEPEEVLSEGGMVGLSGTCQTCQADVVIFPARR